MHRLVVFGITGRMGQALVRTLESVPQLRLTAAVASPQSNALGGDAARAGTPSGILITADAAAAVQEADVAVDFSVPEAVAAHAAICAEAGVALLVGATGFDAAAHAALRAAAERIAVLIAPNTSVGVNVALRLVALAARGLGPRYDVDIIDIHHRTKRDAPSGTALALGRAVAGARGIALEDAAVYDRKAAPGAPRPNGIGFAVVRAGDIVGEHTVVFAAGGERLEITHRAGDRSVFARGALCAAEWLAGREAGLYGMADALGLHAQA